MSRPTALFDVLKTTLRARGVTYRDLAAHLGMSESGVKKMLMGKDLPLGRLLAIAEWLGISAADLVGLAERGTIRDVALSSAQQDALLQDPRLFRVYWRLSVEHETVDQIRQAESLAPAEMRRVVARLTRLELVTSDAAGRVRPRHQGLFRWVPGNPLVDRLQREWSRAVLDAALQANDRSEGVQRLSYLRLTPEAWSDLLRALDATVDEFARRSQRDELTRRPDELRPFRVLIAAAAGRFIDPAVTPARRATAR